MEQFLLRAWYRKQRWLGLLRPLSALYARIAQRRRERYLSGEASQWAPPVPLLVVGNITLGGTGKTPMCLWLIEHFKHRGFRVGVISRGYGARVSEFPYFVSETDSAFRCGDEPLLIARRSKSPVVIDPDRPRGCRALLEQHPLDLIISDDGLQHYPMGRSLELVMIDHARGLGNQRCLPEGPLREPAQRLESVDLIVRNGASHDAVDGFGMQLKPVALINLRSGERCAIEDWSGPMDVAAVAGIGNPARFFDTLRALGFQPAEHAFGDHAQYNAQSFARISPAQAVVMTEKDAVKCAELAQHNWWFLSVEAVLSDAFVAALDARLPQLSSSGAQ